MTRFRCWLLALMLGFLGPFGAVHAADYKQGVESGNDSALIWFQSTLNTTWVDLHYQVDHGVQQNVRMQAEGGRFVHRLGARTGQVLHYFFTYNNGTPAYDSPRHTATVGAGNGSPPPAPPPPTTGAMRLQLVNGTGGAWSDQQVWWAVIGYDPVTRALSWVDRNGRLVPAALGDNDAPNRLVKNGQNYANYFSRLSDSAGVPLPRIDSGRMFISVGSPMYIRINQAADGRLGFAGPNLGNPSDPNQDVHFEWIEFTLDQYGYHGNTTRVDQFGFPLRTRLVGRDGYDRTLGETESRAKIFADFEAQVPAEFRPLVQRPWRIVAPAKAHFNHGKPQGHYFDAYVDEVWNHYRNNELVFTAEAGTFRGRVIGEDFVFSKDGGPANLYIRGRPTTQAILEGSGNLATGNPQELVVQAQITAAFNRHLLVHVDPSRWSDASAYYPRSPANHYAKFWHDHSLHGLAYGFCYDDVRGHSSLQEHPDPSSLTVTVGW
ncbi:glycoside hydrolase family 64 protein [Aquabacterium sp. A7-Y]|uniref:glycoside hydrolase family 64 protein n=1 Tax=Aquabacterium sp. A7-Y TaxID=1349605 RepID=UPI00223DF2CD|nr:glycoside hydrolase family 64 protein [Aquabacterium sp. A7-Y]MCW7540601.1 glycoside hydrolase family 64 protein [Aquabacterium sp. A7-Y]